MQLQFAERTELAHRAPDVGLERSSLLEPMELMEGLGDMRKCALRGPDCDEDNPDELHGTWVTVREDLLRRLATVPVSSGRKDLDDDE